LIVIGLLTSAAVRGQAGVGVPESALREPWVQQLAVLNSLTVPITSVPDREHRARLGEALTHLEAALGKYEAQVDRVIEHIVGDPQFPYVAAETSGALGEQLAEVHARFDALYAALDVQQREDVHAAQSSLDALRKLLQAKVHFERDVLNVFAVLSRQQITELATRWWNGEEPAIAVKKLVADLRQKLEVPRESG
jgi:hypothetical protein